MTQTTLYFQEGNSNKVYQANIQEVGDGFTVNFQYGRKGSALKAGTKTPSPVDRDTATKIFDKLVKAKKSKGYSEGEGASIYRGSDYKNKVSGIVCQLLNPIDEKEAFRLCDDDNYIAQAKHDGERRMIERKDDDTKGINRKGLYTSYSPEIESAAQKMSSQDYVIDTEDMGDVAVAFDLLRYDGNDIRHLPYIERLSILSDMVSLSKSDTIRVTKTAITTLEKKQLLLQLQSFNFEGIVFKRKDAVWNAGRPYSGGVALKHKFYDECTVIVEKVNEGKRSVSFYGYYGDAKVPLGNVTIPPNKAIPKAGDIIELRYLYIVHGGSLYQPTYLKKRTDLEYADCDVVATLRYKNQDIAA